MSDASMHFYADDTVISFFGLIPTMAMKSLQKGLWYSTHFHNVVLIADKTK